MEPIGFLIACENGGMLRAVLWDMDGTLVDSEEYHWLSWRDTMAEDGITLAHDLFLESFGQRNDAILARWLGPDAAAERVQRIGDTKEALYRKLLRAGGLSALPGAAEWVQRLHQEGWAQAIASSAPRANVEAVLEVIDLGACFQAIVAAEDVIKGKPDPQVFLTAAARLGVPPSQCIVVEDVAAGVEAARRAGMRSIGVKRTAPPLPADLPVTSLANLSPDAFTNLIR